MIRFAMKVPGGVRLVFGLTQAEVASGDTLIPVADMNTEGAPILEAVLVVRPSDHDLAEEFAPIIGRTTDVRGSLRQQEQGE